VIQLLLFAVAMTLALLFTAGVRALARRWNLVDAPGQRKIHTVSVPRVGGVGVTLAVLLALAAASAIGRVSAADVRAWLPVLLGGTFMFGVGLWDDLRPLPAWVKLLVQLAGAGVTVALGVRIDHVTFFGVTLGLGLLALPLTIAWIVGLTNAFNVMDGLDGLATGLAIIAAATCAVVSLARGDAQGGMLLIVLLGALCGFLPYNFNPATIFLGDSGSLVVGYVLAVTAITSFQKGATALVVLGPLLLFALPISETLHSVVRRVRGQGLRHVFLADQQHVHYRLLGLGLSHRKVVLLLYGVSLSLSLLALTMMQTR
jgi:UDP-GlcNAc:undecaprenyl-phosphate/decaprenyl-phosphate GlcNAc-1-phosphate transferase